MNVHKKNPQHLLCSALKGDATTKSLFFTLKLNTDTRILYHQVLRVQLNLAHSELQKTVSE